MGASWVSMPLTLETSWGSFCFLGGSPGSLWVTIDSYEPVKQSSNSLIQVPFATLLTLRGPPAIWGSSCPPFASLWDPPGHYWGPPGSVCDPPAALWFPFETLLDLIAPPLGPSWASLPPPFGTLLAPFAPLGTLLAPFGSPLVPLMRRFSHPAPVETVEQSRNHRSAPFPALQTHVCQNSKHISTYNFRHHTRIHFYNKSTCVCQFPPPANERT